MIGELCDDLLAERADLDAILAVVDLGAPTPAQGWSVLDQVTHLAYFDGKSRQAIVDPVAFVAGRDEALADVDRFVDSVARAHRHLADNEARSWLRTAGTDLADAARQAEPSVRVPWYGPDMSLSSSITARIMETWAHGQDVADAAGVDRPPSPRLRHVAFLGWRALANSFQTRGRPVPDEAVRVELDGVVLGPAEARNVVRGPLLDFCLLTTQRRHRADTALVAEGPVADEWLDIAQAFAGPPGAGRSPRD